MSQGKMRYRFEENPSTGGVGGAGGKWGAGAGGALVVREVHWLTWGIPGDGGEDVGAVHVLLRARRRQGHHATHSIWI